MAIRTYKVTLDSKNSISPEPVFLRQGDKTGAVVIDATLMDNGTPVSLNGLAPMFKANTADGKAVIVDSTGFNIVNASGGEFTYQVPSQLGSVDGKIKIAYFSFSDSSGAQSTFNVVFVVEKSVDMTQESAKDWVSNLNEIIIQYNQWVNNAQSSWQDFVNANKEIIESIDPGGTLLNEVIDARRASDGAKFDNLGARLDAQDKATANKVNESDFELSTSLGTMRRLGRLVRKRGEQPANGQGMTSLGGTVAVQYFADDADETKGSLVKFDIVTGEVVLETQITGYHGNSMAYNTDDNMIYYCPGLDQTPVDMQIFKIDPVTLTIVKTIDLTGKSSLKMAHSIGYDNKDKCYVVGDDANIEVYDSSWALKFSVALSDVIGFVPRYMQGVQANGNTLYWLGGVKGQIWVMTLDYQNEKIVYQSAYSFDLFQECIYPIGEIEGLGFNQVTGEIYVSSHIAIGDWSGVTQYFVTTATFKAASSGSDLVSTQAARPSASKIYAGPNTEYSPTGTKNHPVTLLEAATMLRSPYLEFPEIRLTENLDDTLVLTDVTGVVVALGDATVKAVVLNNAHGVYFYGCTTTGRSGSNYAISAYNSDFRANIINMTGITDADGYGLYLERSALSVTSITGGSVYLKNSELKTSYSVASLTKENANAQLRGEKVAVSSNHTANLATGLPADYSYYSKIMCDMSITIGADSMKFRGSADFTGTTDIWDYNLFKSSLYMCLVHLVPGDGDSTMVKVWKIDAGTYKEQTITSMTIAVTLGD